MGLVVLEVPPELVERANRPTEFPNEAAEYAQLQADAAALHAGRNSFIVLSSERDEITKNKLYDLRLLGLEGNGGKQYKTSDVIDARKKAIYNIFGTGFLILGQDGVGSYALSTDKTSTHSYFVERASNFKVDVLDNQLAPRLLAINDIFLDYKDMPYFEIKSSQEADNDQMGKMVQRLKSVGALTPRALEVVYEQLGWPLDGLEDIDFEGKGTSRAGENIDGTSGIGAASMSTSGEGDMNLENAGNKSLDKPPIDVTVDKTLYSKEYYVDMNSGKSLGKV